MIEKLIGDGHLVVGNIRRTKEIPFNPAKVKLEETHPLVVGAAASG